jgi:hypothetical protein
MSATLRCDTIQNASSATANLTLDDAGNATVGNTLVMGSSFKRNRIINGDMRINQRATAVTTTDAYSVDRWVFVKSNDATESVAQNTDAPTGFSYSLRDTISVADTSIGASQYSGFRQIIEGYNVADLGFGTASAKTITISFWVKATQAGTYAVTLFNNAVNRICWKSYTVNNTSGVGWEYKTLTFTGDTTGTWDTTTGGGLFVNLWSALGSSFQGGSDGVWGSSSSNLGPSGYANGLSANGNIFAITGVQLEVGSVATPYERQIYSEQLAQCQRYYQLFDGFNGTSGGNTVDIGGSIIFPVAMRANPTVGATAAFKIDNWGVGSVTQSSSNIGINSGTWVTTRGLAFTMGNFTGLSTQRFYNHAVGTGTITLSAEL